MKEFGFHFFNSFEKRMSPSQTIVQVKDYSRLGGSVEANVTWISKNITSAPENAMKDPSS